MSNPALRAVWLLALAPVAASQVELHKLTASDGAAGDHFGVSVATDGARFVVGASGTDDLGLDSGSVYVYDAATAQELLELHASDGTAGDHFGGRVAAGGGRILVAAFGDDDQGAFSGSVYVFDAATGQELRKLTASDGAAQAAFGTGLAVDRDLAVVGAQDGALGPKAGAVYVFDLVTGAELRKLTASDGEADDYFGASVDVGGGRIVAGAHFEDSQGQIAGAAYVFDATTGQELFKLTASDASLGDTFGSAVAIAGDRILVGASRDNAPAGDSGSAYLFDAATGQELFKLTASDGHFNARFGATAAGFGDRVVVGAPMQGDFSGAVYAFDATTGEELCALTASDSGFNDRLGSSVAIGPGVVLAGSPMDDDLGAESGAAHVFALGGPIGTSYCGPAVPNSTGSPAAIDAFGFVEAQRNAVKLRASGMPANRFGYFLNGPLQGFVTTPPGSQGNLCLSPPIGRHTEAILDSGPTGSFAHALDLTDLPFPGGGHAIVAGETWNWTTWYRDANPGPTSNFTDGVSITFR